MTRWERLQVVAVALVAALVGFSTWANEAIVTFKNTSGNDLSVPVFAANLVVVPLAVLVFGHAWDWALRRLWVRAVLGIAPLPIWSACMLLRHSWPADAVYFMIIGLQMQGINPFGVR